jgi:hypothetical protein
MVHVEKVVPQFLHSNSRLSMIRKQHERSLREMRVGGTPAVLTKALEHRPARQLRRPSTVVASAFKPGLDNALAIFPLAADVAPLCDA